MHIISLQLLTHYFDIVQRVSLLKHCFHSLDPPERFSFVFETLLKARQASEWICSLISFFTVHKHCN